MNNSPDNPGVFIPPPLFYAAIFLVSILLQRNLPIRSVFFRSAPSTIMGMLIITAGLLFAIPALKRFISTRNSVMTIKPANSLQTGGIYSYSRNPMYTGLMLVYTGLAFIYGNVWTILLLPVLIVVVTYLIILPEERYLMRAFGNSYSDYKKQVRRWI